MLEQAFKEKRHHQRYERSCQLDLYRMDQQDHSCYAEMKDYSEGGMSLITGEELVVGQFLYLEIKNHTEEKENAEENKNCSGIVKWIMPDSSAGINGSRRFKYGVEYSTSGNWN